MKSNNSGMVIKELLREKGIKQKWLSKQLNITDSALSQKLNREISIEFTLHILNLIESSLEEFDQFYQKLILNKKEGVVNPTTNRNTFRQEI